MIKVIPFATTLFILLPGVALAAECTDGVAICTFQQLPFVNNAASLTTEDYVNALYRIAISIAAMLVVIRLIWAGVQYMLSEVVTSKEKAKKDIQGALLGLLIVLGAVTILNTINPKITNTNILNRLASQPAGGISASRETPACPEGQVEMMCWDDYPTESMFIECHYPTETNWCTGKITYPQPRTNSWTVLITATGWGRENQISETKAKCTNEGGVPEVTTEGGGYQAQTRIWCRIP